MVRDTGSAGGLSCRRGDFNAKAGGQNSPLPFVGSLLGALAHASSNVKWRPPDANAPVYRSRESYRLLPILSRPTRREFCARTATDLLPDHPKGRSVQFVRSELASESAAPGSDLPLIDLHLHLLPGIDDGAQTLDVSRTMIERACAAGFDTLVATPHLDGPLTQEYRAGVATAWSEVAPIAAAAGIQVGLGYEIKLSPDLAHRLDQGEPSTLAGGRAVLVELPFVGWPNYTEQSLFDLQAAGFRPLLAHPERYADAQRDVDRLIRLAERGVAQQVTFGSLGGLFGKRVQEVAEELLRRDAATVLATDAHSAGQRLDMVEDGIARARALVGPAKLKQLVADNPRALLQDEPLPTPVTLQPDEDETGGWRGALRRFGRR